MESENEKLKRALSIRDVSEYDFRGDEAGEDRPHEDRRGAISENEDPSILRDMTLSKLNDRYTAINYDLGFALANTTTIEQALSCILNFVLQVEDVHAVGVFLINEQGDLELLVHDGVSPEFIDSVRCFGIGYDHLGMIQKGSPLYGFCDEIFENPELLVRENLIQAGVIPIKHNGKVIGSVNIASRATERLKSESKIVLDIITAQIGGTLSRIKSENELKSRQSNFQMMFDTINDFTFILDAEGEIIIANPVVEESLGYTQAELQEMSIYDVHHPDKRDVITYIFDKMLKGQISACTLPLYKKNGGSIPVETKAVKGKWDGKDALYCISRDITERQIAEARLKMQSSAFEALALAIIITDTKGNIEWANSSFSRLSGYTISEIIGKNPSQLIKSGKQDRAFYQNMWDTILSGKVWSGELINKRKDGSFFYEEQTITPVMDFNGVIRSFIAIKIDITSRKEMELALKVSEERWHFAIEASGDSVWDWNMMTKEIFFSDQGKLMLGYSVEEIEPKPGEWEKHVHPDDIKPCLENLNKYLNGEADSYLSEYRMRCKDGSYIWVHDRGKIIEWTTEGKPMRIIGTHKNITNRKLYEEQLRKGLEKEKELNELKSRFVATTSHEFRTPLASILMISDTLISYHQKMNMAQVSSKLLKIKKHVLHLNDIVNNVLQLSKMQEGKIGFNPKNVDIIATCLHIIDGFNIGELYKDQIKFNSPFKTLIINIDKLLIVQSINNLISNALKYSPENSLVNIELNLGKDELLLMVRDRGIGIPEKDIKHLFTPFFRASNSSTIQGNGLGLSIVRESLLLHGGRVSCSNNTDKGSTFILHFPLELIATYSFNPED